LRTSRRRAAFALTIWNEGSINQHTAFNAANAFGIDRLGKFFDDDEGSPATAGPL